MEVSQALDEAEVRFKLASEVFAFRGGETANQSFPVVVGGSATPTTRSQRKYVVRAHVLGSVKLLFFSAQSGSGLADEKFP